LGNEEPRKKTTVDRASVWLLLPGFLSLESQGPAGMSEDASIGTRALSSAVVVGAVELWKSRLGVGDGISKGLRKTRSVFQGPVGGCGKRAVVPLTVRQRRGAFSTAVHRPRQPRQIHSLASLPTMDVDRARVFSRQAPRIRRSSGGVGLPSRTGCPPWGGTSSAAPGMSVHPLSSGRLRAESGPRSRGSKEAKEVARRILSRLTQSRAG
jgi:hypothetical protein